MKKLFIYCLVLFLLPILTRAQSVDYSSGLYVTDYSGNKVLKLNNGRVEWEHKAPMSNDLWVLENGNVLFVTGHGVLELTSDKDTVFNYQSESLIFACQRLKNGDTFVAECNSGKLLEVKPDGTIRKSVSLLKANEKAPDSYMRNARRLDNGNYLVAHYGEKRVCEYDTNGKCIWQKDVPGGPHSVVRIPNGNTLIAVTDMTGDPGIWEVDQKGNLIWSFSNEDTKGEPLKFIGGMQYLSSGYILFANWTGHGNVQDKKHVLLVDRNKKLKVILDNTDLVRTVSSVFLFQNGNKEFH
ncbi:MAG: PQQ-binding-like beta-propeller repeat protein [Tannerellaceae bacterium]